MAAARQLHRSALSALSAVVFALATAGCERPPSADGLREWKPDDHDRAEEQSAQANPANPGGQPNQGNAPQPAPPTRSVKSDGGGSSATPQVAASNAETLLAATWEGACLPCHGPGGHGDGPNGPMVNAPDLTRDDLQSKVTDDDIAAIITNGKNRMPKFDLPDPVVRGLVARIRSMRGR